MSDEKGAPAVDHGDLALRAAVAYRVKNRVAAICDPLIKANSEHIKNTRGLRSTTAEMPVGGPDGRAVPVGTFSRSLSKPSFYVEDERAVFDYAEERDELDYVIRPAFLKRLLARLHYDPATGTVIDPETGEVVQGIGYDPGGETLKVSPHWDAAGVEALDALLGFIEPMLANLPELTAGDFLQSLEAGR
ncbi:hypothetical protein EF903_05320 [Streptomyces sp. WAC05292]|uniref:hypothetical protein n=1 Tax=Streptomyces sp. WAC05292 TaxID=2487418 RepID=UPI000F744A28|nr:hypothetical protein [Streptomyces sp. WAC05292]RSS95062.1 hypothetical protein EF903_05320 [Streptomyces sp. WAC05292]